ncbi:hypothetical protein D5S17_01970 [Pseudonocardiaceae bacterium YIM PH 21723]|nr:hypothetical protein D5S17_01970 [Pseudonocardiaceae bacterium YIM PH 21723]
MSAEEIALHVAGGTSASFRDAQNAIQQLMKYYEEIGNQIQDAVAKSKAGWQGSASTAAESAAKQQLNTINNTHDALHKFHDGAGRQAESFEALKNGIVPIEPLMTQQADSTQGFPQMAIYQASCMRNVSAYQDYAAASSYNTDQFPSTYGETLKSKGSTGGGGGWGPGTQTGIDQLPGTNPPGNAGRSAPRDRAQPGQKKPAGNSPAPQPAPHPAPPPAVNVPITFTPGEGQSHHWSPAGELAHLDPSFASPTTIPALDSPAGGGTPGTGASGGGLSLNGLGGALHGRGGTADSPRTGTGSRESIGPRGPVGGRSGTGTHGAGRGGASFDGMPPGPAGRANEERTRRRSNRGAKPAQLGPARYEDEDEEHDYEIDGNALLQDDYVDELIGELPPTSPPVLGG